MSSRRTAKKQHEKVHSSDEAESSSSDEHDKDQEQIPEVTGKHKSVVGHSGIVCGANVVTTVAGPIREWLPLPENLPNHPTICFFGKRRTGKSTSITNLAFHTMQGIPFGIVMSNTSYAGYWDLLVPKRCIVQGLRQDWLDWLVGRQKKLIAKYGIKDKRVAAFIILDDVVADQKTIRYNADLSSFFVEGRHLAITVLIASQYVKGLGPMVRGNCDYIILQPIYNKTQRDTLWDLEAAFMDKKDFSLLMDQVIVSETLPGNTAADPKKKVRVMVCADFEDSCEPTEKFYHWSPVHMTMLPKFRLCDDIYWKDNDRVNVVEVNAGAGPKAPSLIAAEQKLRIL